MIHFDPGAPIKLETEASKYVCSGILSQQCENRKWRPEAYRSKTMQDAECNYDIHDKELLAISQAFAEWKRYLRGSPKPVRVPTEHINLATFMRTKELRERQARWKILLSQYNFRIEYRPGKDEGNQMLLREEPETYPQQKTNDSRETSGHYFQENAGTYLKEKKSRSRKWS